MSGTGNFTSSYKIPRRRQNTAETVETSNKNADTLSPLSKKPTTSKSHFKPQATKVSLPSNSKSREQHRSSNHRDKHQSVEQTNKQKAAKRKAYEHEPPIQKYSRPNNDDPMELLDNIWKEMDEYDNRQKKSDDQQREGSMSPTTSPFFQAATPIPSAASAPKLTRYELMNAPKDDTIFRAFLTKPNLMERILGYKMQNSRVDTYEFMRKPAKLDECQSIEFDESFDYGVPAYYTEHPSTSTANSSKRRGPETPPGSPNHEPEDAALSTDEWHSRSAHSTPSHHSDSKVAIKTTKKPETKEYSSRAELLQTFSQATNTPVEKLEELIGADLQNAIGRVAKSVLLNTLKDAIRNVSVPNTSSKPTPLNRVFDKDTATSSPAMMTGNCEMACSSTDSNASSDNSPLLPPPPAPPMKTTQPVDKFPSPMPVKMNVPVQSSSMPVPLLSQEFKPPPIQLITSVPPPRIQAPSTSFQMPDFSRPPPAIPNLQTLPPPIRNPPAFPSNPPRMASICVPPPQRNPYPMAGPPSFNQLPPSLISFKSNVPGQRPPFPVNYPLEPTGFNPMINGPPAQPTYPPPFRHPSQRP